MGIILHRGRKSHRIYETPVMVFRRNDRFVIALTYGVNSEWVKNVIAQNGCKLETQGQTLTLTHPQIFHDAQRLAMPRFVRLFLALLNVSDFVELIENHRDREASPVSAAVVRDDSRE